MMMAHVGNFLHCMRTREKPHLDVETAAHAQVLISLAVDSYRDNKVKYWDEKELESGGQTAEGLVENLRERHRDIGAVEAH